MLCKKMIPAYCEVTGSTLRHLDNRLQEVHLDISITVPKSYVDADLSYGYTLL